MHRSCGTLIIIILQKPMTIVSTTASVSIAAKLLLYLLPEAAVPITKIADLRAT